MQLLLYTPLYNPLHLLYTTLYNSIYLISYRGNNFTQTMGEVSSSIYSQELPKKKDKKKTKNNKKKKERNCKK